MSRREEEGRVLAWLKTDKGGHGRLEGGEGEGQIAQFNMFSMFNKNNTNIKSNNI